MAQKYGNTSRILLNNDAIFLALLTYTQLNNPPRKHWNKCILNGQKLNRIELDYAAAIAIQTAKTRINDEHLESPKPKTLLLSKILTRIDKQSKKELKKLKFNPSIFNKATQTQQKIESKPKQTLDELCQPTALVVSTLFKHTAIIANRKQNIPFLSEIGKDIGALMYITDNIIDLASDIQENKFNPFKNSYNQNIPEFIEKRLNNIHQNCKKLTLKQGKEIITRTLTSDLLLKIKDTISNRNNHVNLSPVSTMISSTYLLAPLVSQDDSCCCTVCEDSVMNVISKGILSSILGAIQQDLMLGGASAVSGGIAASTAANLIASKRLQKPPTDPNFSLNLGEEPSTGPELPIERGDLIIDLRPPFPILQTPPPELATNGVWVAGIGDQVWESIRSLGGEDWNKIVDAFQKGRESPEIPDREKIPEHLKTEDDDFFEVMKNSVWKWWYQKGTAEEQKQFIESLEKAGSKLKPAFGSGGELTKTYHKILPGREKEFLTQLIQDYYAERLKKQVKIAKGILKSRTLTRTGGGVSNERFRIPGGRTPSLNRTLEEAAKQVGTNPNIVRDVSGVLDGVIDVLSIDVDDFIEWFKVYKMDPAGNKAITEFIQTYNHIPNPKNHSDIERLSQIYQKHRGALEE